MTGILNLSGAPAAAAAPMAGCASPEALDNATLVASQQSAQLRGTNSSLDGSQAQVQILCRPVPARRADSAQSTTARQQSSGCNDFHFDTASLRDLIYQVAVLAFNLGMVVMNLMWMNRRYMISYCPEFCALMAKL